MAYRVSETKANSDYILKNEFENMKEIQDFERENISMSRPKTPYPIPLTRPMELPEHFTNSPEKNGKAHVSEDPDPDSSFSYSSPKKKKRDKKKKHHKHKNRVRQTHHPATILIRPTIVITEGKNPRGRVIGKMTQSKYLHV